MRAMFSSLFGFKQPLRGDLEGCAIPSRDGSRLEGALIKAMGQPKGVIIFCHPFMKYGYHYFIKSGHIDIMSRAGFEGVLFNFKGFGGSKIAGPSFYDDVLGALDFAHDRFPGMPVHILGSSFGGYHAVHALAQPGVQAQSAFLDSVPPRATNFFRKGPLGVAFRFLNKSPWGSLCGTTPLTDDLDQIKRTPLHFVYGDADKYYLEGERHEFSNRTPESRFTMLPGAGHLEAIKKDPARYEQILHDHFLGPISSAA